MHPAHFPFVVKAQSACIDRPAYHRVSGRFFGSHNGIWEILEDNSVKLAQESDGLQVVVASELVFTPFVIVAVI